MTSPIDTPASTSSFDRLLQAWSVRFTAGCSTVRLSTARRRTGNLCLTELAVRPGRCRTESEQ
jgi:hypothetical protein